MTQGRGLDDQEFKGLVPRVVDEVFDVIMASSDKFEFTIRVTILEIYNEKIQDLLDSKLLGLLQPTRTTCRCARTRNMEFMWPTLPRSTSTTHKRCER